MVPATQDREVEEVRALCPDHDDRIALIAVDYPNRRRLKLLGSPDPDPDLCAALGLTGRLEGLVTVEVAAFDWNCPKFINPRYT